MLLKLFSPSGTMMVRCFILFLLTKVKNYLVQINPLQSPFYTLNNTYSDNNFALNLTDSRKWQHLILHLRFLQISLYRKYLRQLIMCVIGGPATTMKKLKAIQKNSMMNLVFVPEEESIIASKN